jgi:CHAT domain-containing protein
MAAYALKGIAAIYAEQGKRAGTLGNYEKVLNYYRSVGDTRGQALILNDIGDFFLSVGGKGQALNSYRKALAPSRQSGDRGVELSTLYNIARAERDSGDLDGALAHVEQSIKTIEALRTSVASPEFRSSYLAGVYKHFELYIDVLMRLDRERPGRNYAAAALLAVESARARSLLEIILEDDLDLRRGVDPKLLARERELQQLLRAQAQYQLEVEGSGRPQAEAAEVARGVEQLRAEYQDVQARLRQQVPRGMSPVPQTPLSMEALCAELRDENTLLLEYALGDEKSYLWAVTDHSLNSYELPPRAVLENAAREVHALLSAPQQEVDAGYQARVQEADRLLHEKALALSRMLLGPVAGQLGEKRLLVVTEGVLQYVPFDALPDPSEDGTGLRDILPLVSRHEVISLPSVSTLATIRRERPRAHSPEKVLAVLADPVFSRDDVRVQGDSATPPVPGPAAEGAESSLRAFRDFQKSNGKAGTARLIYSGAEADAILASAPRGAEMVAKGFDASRETAMSQELGQYQIVHFATHSFINSENPELSGIILSMVNRSGGQEDGFLQLHDIYSLKLSADLVVLSACDTGRGKDIKGEGLVGLTRGFLYAGSKSVVASLWKVDDRATAELMEHFYRALLQEGLPPAAALRKAKDTMRGQKRWEAPFYWAGFVLQGEYREHIDIGHDSSQPLSARPALVLASLLLSAGLITFGLWRYVARHR